MAEGSSGGSAGSCGDSAPQTARAEPGGGAQTRKRKIDSADDILDWLKEKCSKSINLEAVGISFRAEGIRGEHLPKLTQKNLTKLGVTTIGAQMDFFSGLEKLRTGNDVLKFQHFVFCSEFIAKLYPFKQHSCGIFIFC